MALTLSTKQQHAIQLGAILRQRLVTIATKAATPNATSKHPHTYIFSPPGLGKTYTVEKAIEQTNIAWHSVSGSTTMFAFGIDLAVINYLDKTSSKIVIAVDDCDAILGTSASCDIVKNMLTGKNSYNYTKNMASQMSSLTELQQAAVKAHMQPSTMGFEVPCDRFVFVFTSNFKLPTDDDVNLVRARGGNTKTKAGQNAIRSRCQTNDFDMDWEEQWGWIGDVVLNTTCLDAYNLIPDDKLIILDWLYNNWRNLTERSIRTAEKMAGTLKEYPATYKDVWDVDFIK